MADSSILLPISLGLNYQHHHQDIYGILELFPFPESNTGEAKGASAEGEESSKASPVAHYQLQNALCLIDIPDLFLPKDILQYFQYLLPSILSFRIFHHYFPNTQQYILVLIFPSQLSCQRFADQYENKMISSVYDIHCRFYCIQSLSLQTYYEHIPIVSSHQLNTLFSPHQIVEAKELLSTVTNGISRSSPKTLGSTSRERSGTLASVGPRSRSNTPMNLPIPLSDSLPSLNLNISVSPHQLQRKTSHDYRHNQVSHAISGIRDSLMSDVMRLVGDLPTVSRTHLQRISQHYDPLLLPQLSCELFDEDRGSPVSCLSL